MTSKKDKLPKLAVLQNGQAGSKSVDFEIKVVQLADRPTKADSNLKKLFAHLRAGESIALEKSTNITQAGQFGLSYTLTLSNPTRCQLFLKLPPRPEDAKPAPQHHDSTTHYKDMRARFKTEFEKNHVFAQIIDGCSDLFKGSPIQFSIACPLALVEVQIAGESQETIPGLLYEFKGQDVTESFDKFRAATALDFFNFANGLARLVQLIHNHGILHSFLVPRNILRTPSTTGFSIVGFGYSIFCDSKPNTPYMSVSETDRLYRAPECMETESLGALWYPADIFSVGAILFKFATGKHPPSSIPKDVERLKRLVYESFSQDFPDPHNTGHPTSLLLLNENIVKILDKCLRYAPEDRFSCAEELIESLEIAEASGIATFLESEASSPAQSNEHQFGQSAKRQNASATTFNNSNALSPLFQGLFASRRIKLNDDLGRMEQGHYELYGHRDVLVSSLCRMIAGASPGDLYCTMTMPSYWTDENLGTNGRFLTMNKHMARRGLRIQRLFLVTQDFHELSEQEQDILEAQRSAQENVQMYLERAKEYCTAKKIKWEVKGTFEIKVKKLENAKLLTRFETDSTQVAYLETTKEPTERLCLNFISQGRYAWLNGTKIVERWIKKIRYWIPKGFRETSFNESTKQFSGFWDSGALTLNDYMGPRPESVKLEKLLSSP